MSASLTNQYLKFYEKYSELYGNKTCIMMLVGKFYELYDLIDVKTGEPKTPVKKATEIMNIVLKEKTGGFLEAGVPEQSLHKFSQMLTRQGWTVVVVDQIKDSTDSVIDRVATRILSPGTHIEMATQDRMSVASLYLFNTGTSISVLDLTTGETISYFTKRNDEIQHILQIYCVKEVLCVAPKELEDSNLQNSYGLPASFHRVDEDLFYTFSVSDFRREEFFRRLFSIKGLLPVRSSLGLPVEPISKELELGLCLLLRFVEDHFPQQSERLTSHKVYSPSEHMRLSNNILEQLNIITSNPSQKSILNILERTYSSIGKRAMRERILRPITNGKELEKRWEQVEWATNTSVTFIEKILKALYDIPRLHFYIAEGSIDSVSICQLFQSYAATGTLIQNLKSTPLAASEDLVESIQDYRKDIERYFDEEKAIQRNNDKFVGMLTPIAGPRTLEIENKIKVLEEEWKTKWNTFCNKAGILTSSFELVKKNDGEYIWEGTRSTATSIKKASTLKDSPLTHVELELKKSGPIQLTCKEFTVYSETLRKLWSQLNKTLKEELVVVCDDLWNKVKHFQEDWVEWLGRVDCTIALATVAKENDWCKPKLSITLSIHGLRHPLLENAQTRVKYVKHDVNLGKTSNGWLIYGVNASGKSSLMKSVGIAAILAQAGSFVPATSMEIRPYDAAFSRIWSHDNVWAGLSSFAVEVTELRDMLIGVTDRSLVLGDEVCSGTESTSATSLVASVLEHLDSKGAHFIFATHLHDLIEVPGFLPRPGISIWHLRVDRTETGKLIYDRRLQPGPGSSSYGLEVASAMGLPFSIMNRANEIRRSLLGKAAANEAPVSKWNTNIQRYICEVCGCSIVDKLEVHHIEERAKGGSNELRNLVVLCEKCHDKHHAGELTVGSIVQTSEGLERDIVQQEENKKPERKSKTERPEEEIQKIVSIATKYKGRPLTRTILALEEEGIKIKQTELKRIIHQ